MRILAVVLVALATVHVRAAAQQPDRLTLADYLEWESVSGPRLSPDGRQILYTRGWVDKVNDRRESSLYLMNADGSRPRKLLDGGSAEWSPDGTRIAFNSLRNGQFDIFVMNLDGTDVRQLTTNPGKDFLPRWSPDGKSILFHSDAGGESDDIHLILLQDPTEAAPAG